MSSERAYPTALAPAVPVASDTLLLASSLAVLLLSTADTGVIAGATRACWLGVFCLLCATNLGSATSAYVAAATLYGTRKLDGWGSPLERPDNFALMLLVGALAIAATQRASPARRQTSARLTAKAEYAAALFVAYGLVQGAAFGILNRWIFAWFMRAFGIPFVIYILLRRAALGVREVRAFATGITILTAYAAAFTILEKFRLEGYVLPPWIGEENASSSMLAASYRMGGLMMQYEWNGYLLGLGLCLTVLAARLRGRSTPWDAVVVGMTLVALALTLTRGAWLATALAGAVLMARPAGTPAATALKRTVLVFGIVTAAIGLTVAAPRSLQERAGDSDTMYFRFTVWATAGRVAAAHPLTGVGFTKFPTYAPDYLQTVGDRAPQSLLADEEGVSVHNTLIEVAVEFGLIGLALYVPAVLWQFWLAYGAMKTRWGGYGGAWVIALGVTYFINGQFVFAHELVVNVIYYATLGMLAGARTLHAPQPGADVLSAHEGDRYVRAYTSLPVR
jgi:O-antigen ligase